MHLNDWPKGLCTPCLTKEQIGWGIVQELLSENTPGLLCRRVASAKLAHGSLCAPHETHTALPGLWVGLRGQCHRLQPLPSPLPLLCEHSMDKGSQNQGGAAARQRSDSDCRKILSQEACTPQGASAIWNHPAA